jgi:hypothetical protein
VQNPEPDLNAIARRLEAQKSMRPESWDAWCLHAVSDVASLLAHVRALEAERARLREAIDFYANEDRYDYDQTCCPSKSNPGRKEPDGGVLEDSGQRARAALDPNRSE